MRVHEVPTSEEFFGLVDNEIDDGEFEAQSDDEKKEKMIAILLSLLQEFYLMHKYDTEYYIASMEFEEAINGFNELLKENLQILFAEYLEGVQAELNLYYGMPAGTVETSIKLDEVLNSGIDAVTSTLYTDLKNKADFFKDINTTGNFSLHSNFRRAIKKLNGVAENTAQSAKNMVTREYMSFVYGQEALFNWRVAGRNTCAWCYEMEAMGPMPLSWFPIDHVNGHCRLEPVNPDEYSDEYLKLKGW